MKRLLAVAAGAIALIALVFVSVTFFEDSSEPFGRIPEDDRARLMELSERVSFSDRNFQQGGEPFPDETVDSLIAEFEQIAAETDVFAQSGDELEQRLGSHRNILYGFVRILGGGTLSAEQEERVVALLDEMAESHPDDAEHYETALYQVQNLLPGKVAPNIVGMDFDGEEFELADYRGKVVTVVFTGDWCPPCRGEYPYHRTLLDVMDPEHFVLLGVNSDDDLEVAKAAKERESLPYRTWWDGHGERRTRGPIATQWKVSGWPTVFVIDEEGVIRVRGGSGARRTNLLTVAKELTRDLEIKIAEANPETDPELLERRRLRAEAMERAATEIRFRTAEYDTGGEPFTDEIVDEIIGTLDALIAQVDALEDVPEEEPADGERPRRRPTTYGHVTSYLIALSQGYVTEEQELRVEAQLDRLGASHPGDVELYDNARLFVDHLLLGKEAPNVFGTDFDGVEFELSEYRGKVVAMVFTGHWCPPCRAEYPYQRLLLEVVDEEDFALLGVNSDDDLQVAKDAKVEETLPYRLWWDGHGEIGTRGPISTEWSTRRWPTIYLIDENGIIRDRDIRQEELVERVQEMVGEMKAKRAEAAESG